MEVTAGEGRRFQFGQEGGRSAGEGMRATSLPALLLSSLSTNLVDYWHHMAFPRGCQPLEDARC